MKKKTLSVLALLISVMTASAQQLSMTVSVAPADTTALSLYLQGGVPSASEPVEMARDAKGNYSVTINADEQQYYNLTCMKNGGQYTMSLFLNDGEVKYKLAFKEDIPDQLTPVKPKKVKKGEPDPEADVQAMMEFFRTDCKEMRDFYLVQQTAESASAAVTRLREAATAIASRTELSERVRRYVSIWAYVDCYNMIDNYNRMHEDHVDGAALLQVAPPQVLDTPIARLHHYAMMIAYINVPKKDLASRIEYVREKYSTPVIRDEVEKMVLNNYLRYYRFEQGGEKGLMEITEAKRRFDIPDSYLEQYKERMSAVTGAIFPDVALEDEAGNRVDFAQFRGKYVYVDLWASWCVPCCKEAPFLIELEKQVKNPNVVFVSISNDSNRDAWLKKKAALGLHGNQLWDASGQLCNKLNVQGIPRFLIYNPEGKMFSYNAPRPSSDEIRELLESLK